MDLQMTKNDCLEKRFTIIRDTREQTGWNWIASEYCVGTIVTKLDTGDYSLGGLEDRLCIERKRSVSEFATNIVEKRFTRELERMAEFPVAFLICEFDMYDIDIYPEGSGIPRRMFNKIKVRRNFILSKLVEIQTKYNIFVNLCGSDVEMAKQITFSIMRNVWKNQ